MKWYKKAVLALALLLGAGAALPAAAAEQKVTRVTFENAPSSAPDLYVKKTVESSAQGYLPPADQEYSFVLKLDGALAEDEKYRVFDKNGEEVFRLGDALGAAGIKIPFRTDRNGNFTLKADQTALFEYVGAGVSYEITEYLPEGFRQIQPAGGAPASGVVPPGGAVVEFKNLYEPGGTGTDTDLMIRKTVSFPAGYEPWETPDFAFRLKLGGQPWAHEKYEVQDTESGQVLEEQTTDKDGRFTLKGGQTAVFRGVPVNLDYEVREETPEEGWSNTGEETLAGSTKAPAQILTFNNRSASFAVEKRMEDGSVPDREFRFLLLRGDSSVWSGASYRLYSSFTGKPVDDAVHTTDGSGYFTLKAGETAIFYGIAPGTIFQVSEEAGTDYQQVVPADPEGYPDWEVKESVELLPFVNRMVPEDGRLSVTKLVTSPEGEAPKDPAEFTFVLSRKTTGPEGEAIYEPQKEALYSITRGSQEETYRTSKEGIFTLKANETARFSGLERGAVYQVKEIDLPLEYEAKLAVQEDTLTENGLAFTFENQYFWRQVDLMLHKKDRKDQPLQGAEFLLYRDAGLQNPVREEPYVSNNAGEISIPALKSGVYYLKETKSPEGYQLLVKPIKLEIRWEGEELKAWVEDEEAGTDDAGQIHIQQKPAGASGNDTIHITVYNSKGFLLPDTGSGGIFLFLGAGLAGILLTFAYYRKHRSALPTGDHDKKERER